MFKTMFNTSTKAIEKPKDKVNVADGETDDQIMSKISAALANDGFDVVKVREKALKVMNYKALLILLVAYVRTGNSLTTKIAAGKVVDKAVAQNVQDLMRSCGVIVKSSTCDGLTLPRLAIAFAGIVASIRHKLNLPSRIPTTTPAHLQDLCMNGYISLAPIASASDFVEKFSWVLSQALNKKNAGKKGFVAVTEEISKGRVIEFREMATMNLNADVIGRDIMKSLDPSEAPSVVAVKYGFKDVKAEVVVNTTEVVEEEQAVDDEEEE